MAGRPDATSAVRSSPRPLPAEGTDVAGPDPSCARFDPLAGRRDSRDVDAPPFDLFLQGMVFLDIIFTGLPQMPRQGQEVWAAYDAIVTEGGWASQPKQGSPDLLA